jgi:hypothetical protein
MENKMGGNGINIDGRKNRSGKPSECRTAAEWASSLNITTKGNALPASGGRVVVTFVDGNSFAVTSTTGDLIARSDLARAAKKAGVNLDL